MALIPLAGRHEWKVRLLLAAIFTFLVIGIVIHLIPFWWMITTSIKPPQDLFAIPPKLWPSKPTLVPWTLMFRLTSTARGMLPVPLWRYVLNSLIVVTGAMALTLPVTSLCAYANSKLQRSRWARLWYLFFIGNLMVPPLVSLIPRVLLIHNFPWAFPEAPFIPFTNIRFPSFTMFDTLFALFIPSAFNAGYFLYFKAYFDTIPDSVIQAARVDGGSEFHIFRKIVLPMSLPIYAVVVWWQFTGIWSDFMWPLLNIRTPERMPLAVALYKLQHAIVQAGNTHPAASEAMSKSVGKMLEAGLSWNGLMVLATLETIPLILIFLFCRKYLLKGVRIRGMR
ncbi:MAG: carbohydrate ABC transporter permease [Patescibacteria group bacterium]